MMTDHTEQDLSPVFPFARLDHGCFGCGDNNPIGLHLHFTPTRDGVTASFVPQLEHQGFDDVVHGGIISTVLDEAMAWATAHAGIWAVTGEMRVRFRNPLAVGVPTTVTAKLTGSRGRTIATSAELTLDRDGTPVASATASFVRVSDTVAAEWQDRYLSSRDTSPKDRTDSAGVAIDSSCENLYVGDEP